MYARVGDKGKMVEAEPALDCEEDGCGESGDRRACVALNAKESSNRQAPAELEIDEIVDVVRSTFEEKVISRKDNNLHGIPVVANPYGALEMAESSINTLTLDIAISIEDSTRRGAHEGANTL